MSAEEFSELMAAVGALAILIAMVYVIGGFDEVKEALKKR